jgi:hypothetical protein
MSINPLLTADFSDRPAPFGIGGTELARLVQLLENAADLAVASFLGWRLDVTLGGRQERLTSVEPGVVPGDILASLQVPLAKVLSSVGGGSLTLYAAQPDAFTALVVDVAAALHLPVGQFAIDQDLTPDLGVPGPGEPFSIGQPVSLEVHTDDFQSTGQGSSLTDLSTYRKRKVS